MFQQHGRTFCINQILLVDKFFVNELPAQTQNKDGVLQFRFEVLLSERRENTPQVPSFVQPVQPRPANYNNDFENDDDIPF